ncbi:FG-GAP-like repeat-containing protein [Occallatibacter savannae]|uniref:FG-GAP-like repeat-containing protein n=1 Tax=Occallatibacter savannae TaxID=1002691 RepID=UPI0013A5408C|nr:FG-GAP-like repeat-containing protein [Occallatibacter savannae]
MRGWPIIVCATFVLLALLRIPLIVAEAEDGSRKLDLAIIVLPTLKDAEAARHQVQNGADFAVLAREKSVDATSVDGGYMGKLDPDQLRPELRKALNGLRADELTGIIPLPSGFAIVKVLASAPNTTDINPARISSLLATGAIRFGAQISGLNEADAVFMQYSKPDGWERDLEEVCRIRTESLAHAKKNIRANLSADRPSGNQFSLAEKIQGHSAVAQLFAYSGEMNDSIEEWKIAYSLAQSGEPQFLPNLEESLGTSYLHLAEMENDVYQGSKDVDIFPPLNPHASYSRQEASKLAIGYFNQYLQDRPDDLEVRWLLNLAYMTLGQYPAGVPNEFLFPETEFHSKQSIGKFRDVAPAEGLNSFRAAGGLIVDDFDNDGQLDVVASSMDVCDPIRFFHNNGDGTFSDRTQEAGILDQLGGLNIVQADYNNDGCMDILVLRGGWEFPHRKSLLRNNCNGTFTDVTDASGLGITVTATQSAAWADIDNDGLLDLFIANEGAPAQLFHNRGNGTFEEIGKAAGIDETAFSKGVTAADYDGDGFVDFYVTHQHGTNSLFHNNGNKTFTEVGREAGVQAPSFSFATWFFDYDNDGWPDLFVAGYLTSVPEALKTYAGIPQNAETLKLYHNKHDGTFEDVTAKVGLNKVYMPMGSNFGDIDNDGYLDFYLGVGQPSYAALLPHVLFRNNEGKSFVDVTESSGTGELHKGHGIAFADLRRRGSEDIVAQIGGAVPGDKHSMRVFENPGSSNDWLNVRLVGVKSNREASGAQIHVTVRSRHVPARSIHRTVGQTSSFGGNPLEQHIGLGPQGESVDLDIYWPVSDTRQHFAGIRKDQFIEIKEFAPEYKTLERTPVPRPAHLNRVTSAQAAR